MFGQVDGAICANSTAKVRLPYHIITDLLYWDYPRRDGERWVGGDPEKRDLMVFDDKSRKAWLVWRGEGDQLW